MSINFGPKLASIKKKDQLGFTLIELLVVATILVVLMTIGLVSYRQVSRNSRNAKRKADLESVRQALVLYYNQLETYPTGGSLITPTATAFSSMLSELSAEGYLSVSDIADPKNETPYQYLYGADVSGNEFTLCGYLEAESGSEEYCLTNP